MVDVPTIAAVVKTTTPQQHNNNTFFKFITIILKENNNNNTTKEEEEKKERKGEANAISIVSTSSNASFFTFIIHSCGLLTIIKKSNPQTCNSNNRMLQSKNPRVLYPYSPACV